ncbi:MAG: ribosome small subunit-dependent GTPase A [Acidobacteria bacterium]|nr:ribosome small subunit-dependent GTPase A [Acidobacteriota bacterium]
MNQPDLVRARVSFGAQEEYRVILDCVEFPAHPAGALRAFQDLPVVGDWVYLRHAGGFGLIETVEPRQTAFVRKAPGRTAAGQCVAANVDVVFVVCGLDGDFSPRRLERYLVLAFESGARPVVVLNKSDVCADLALSLEQAREAAADADLLVVSARESAEPLRPWLRPGVTAALLGSSGAGKSTIANALGAGDLLTREVRASDSRGRHTTTARMLIQLPGGAWLMDTPGMRQLGLLAGGEALERGFPEITGLAAACRFSDCQHISEPGCAVQRALADGTIGEERWASYRKLTREARHNARQADANAQQADKKRWKAVSRAQRRLFRERDRGD